MVRIYLVLGLGVAVVSFAALLIRLAEAPPLIVAATRLVVASLVTAPLAFVSLSRSGRRTEAGDVFGMIVAGLFLALHFGLWITSLQYTSVATSVVLVTISPIFLGISSRFLFGQRLSHAAIIGIAVASAGGIMIGYANWQNGVQSLLGGVLAVGGALAISGYYLIGQRLRQSTSTVSYVGVVYGAAAVALAAAALASGRSFVGYPPSTYFWMALLGLGPQLVGHSSLNWSLKYVPATMVAIAVLGEPVGATIWALVFLREHPAFLEIVGGAIILVGLFVAMKGGVLRTERRTRDAD